MIKESELIINPDGSIYHLNLKPGEIADTIITVGDQDRVDNIVQHFDTITTRCQNREFKTVTGSISNKQLTVISTGIGSDNIDIVINELDALINVDFETRKIKNDLRQLKFIRMGTSGSINPDVPLNSIVVSKYAVGLDGLLNHYDAERVREQRLEMLLKNEAGIDNIYAVGASHHLCDYFESLGTTGITLTANGFYGPQSRSIRIQAKTDLVSDLKNIRYNNTKFTNIEMETAGIFGLSKLMGHEAISLNAILATRYNGEFSKNPQHTVDGLIKSALEMIVEL